MKLKFFMSASLQEQKQEIKMNGSFVEHRVKGVYAIHLFQLHDYYVETYYHLHELRLDRVNCFDCDAKELTPYLKKIAIDGLISV